MLSASSRIVATLCVTAPAVLAAGCEADWGSNQNGWGRNGGWSSGNWNHSGCSGDAAVVVIYAAVIAVAIVVDGTAHLISDISDRFRDGSGGIAWDSAEGRRLRGE